MTALSCRLQVRDINVPEDDNEFLFEQEQILIGRTSSCDLTLLNPRRIVSRRHAVIRQQDGQFHLVDLGSKNTTRLNGQRLTAEQPYPLRHGDSLRVGDFEICFSLANGAATSQVFDLAGDSAAGLLSQLYGSTMAQPHGGSGIGGAYAQRAVEELILLSELAFDVGASFEVKGCVETILRHALHAVKAEQGMISLLDETDDPETDSVATFIRSHLDAQPAFTLDPALLAWMREHEAPLRQSRTQEEQDLSVELRWQEGVHAFLCMPLLVRGRLIGLLTVFNKQGQEGFSAADERLLAIIAAQTAQVVENARLHTAAKELEQARALRQTYAALEEAHCTLKATQTQLVHQEKLASLGTLTAGLAHEIKNPLNFITNFSEIAVDLADGLSDEIEANLDKPLSEVVGDFRKIISELKLNATKIAEHGRRADGIVRNMLEHAGGTTSRRQAVDLNALVDEYVELVSHCMQAEGSGIPWAVERDLDEAVGQVELAPQEIGRVLINLLNNACYAVRERWRADQTGYMPRIRIATRPHPDGVEFCVEDNGSGIPDDVQARIFDPFFTTKPASQGTGLGLSISHDIVTGHGGLMQVTSRPGEGARFVVRLQHAAPAFPTTRQLVLPAGNEE